MTEPPAWSSAAGAALTAYVERTGQQPTQAVISAQAAIDMVDYVGRCDRLFGIPVHVDYAIDGIYYRMADEAQRP